MSDLHTFCISGKQYSFCNFFSQRFGVHAFIKAIHLEVRILNHLLQFNIIYEREDTNSRNPLYPGEDSVHSENIRQTETELK